MARILIQFRSELILAPISCVFALFKRSFVLYVLYFNVQQTVSFLFIYHGDFPELSVEHSVAELKATFYI